MELVYTVKRSKERRKLTITVERDRRVIVHAPIETPDEIIREMVEAKRRWIYEKINHDQKYRDLPHPPGKELVNGESALYLGREYRVELVQFGLAEVEFAQRFLIAAAQALERRRVLRDWYFKRAGEMILPKAQSNARQLGVSFKQARIVDNRYRWGSCTVKDCVNFNWRLIKAPMSVIDYVVVHELAHLLEANHTARFWNIVRTQTPTMEKARAWLKDHGQILEEDI